MYYFFQLGREEDVNKENKELSTPVMKIPKNNSPQNLNTRFPCPVCESGKPSFSHLRVHIGIAHYKDEVGKFANLKDNSCKVCKREFNTRQQVVTF